MARLHMREGLLLLLACTLLSGRAAAGKLEHVNGHQVIPGRILLRLAHGEKAAADVRNIGFKFRRSFRLARAQLWRTPRGMPVARAVRIARRIPGVIAVEPDYVRKIDLLPNDTYYSKQYAPGKMNLTDVWDSRTAADVIVAVIDTGIQRDHPDLADNVYVNPNEQLDGQDTDGNGYIDDVGGWDFVGSDLSSPVPDNDPSDFHGHGTSVSGVIGAIGNNTLGVAGVAWQVKILPIKIGEDSTTPNLSSLGSIQAVDYAVGRGAIVINASYSGDTYSHFELDAIQAAQEAGVIFVTAAGNSGADIDANPAWPSFYNLANILSVAATTSSDSMPSWSN
ncbi:MAG: S8 family serine peptidase [Planctomycetes bacterium]|nr:S8 family serine peptidase [Planctomycetota bacterium]